MKKINIIYWICTILLSLVMAGGAIPDIMNIPDAKAMLVDHLHYPVYFGPFIGTAKVLGVIAILVPGFPKLKEWAYAGLAFDLIGATYSAIAVGDSIGKWAPMFIFFALLAGSYIYYHKRVDARQAIVQP